MYTAHEQILLEAHVLLKSPDVRWGRWIRNVPWRPQTLEDSLPDEGGGDTHGRSTIGVPLASRPWIPYPRFPYSMPPPYEEEEEEEDDDDEEDDAVPSFLRRFLTILAQGLQRQRASPTQPDAPARVQPDAHGDAQRRIQMVATVRSVATDDQNGERQQIRHAEVRGAEVVGLQLLGGRVDGEPDRPDVV